MVELGTLFSSKARTDILRVLHELADGAGIRQVARLAAVYPRSAERVLAQLTSERLALCRKSKGQTVYSLNHDHPDAAVLAAIFEAANRASIQQASAALHDRAASILPFITETSTMLKRARSGLGDA